MRPQERNFQPGRFVIRHQTAVLISTPLVLLSSLRFIPVIVVFAPLAMLPGASRREFTTLLLSIVLGMVVMIALSMAFSAWALMYGLGRGSWQ